MSDDIDDNWDEVFKDLEITSVPIKYLIEILIHLTDGRTIIIDIDHKQVRDFEELEDDIDDFIDQYDELIDTIDFRVDTEKVKKDITKITRSLMKRTK
jgi:hypothetical protein